MSARWECTEAERQAVLENQHPAATLALVVLLLALTVVLGACLQVAG